MGMIFDIQRFSIHDGPGIRTVVFLKGCPLQCTWCHNPESQCSGPLLGFSEQLCTGCGACAVACTQGCHVITAGSHPVNRAGCTGCGACVKTCPAAALEVAGREATVEEVMQTVYADMPFYQFGSGGLTVSGGEPTAQPNFTTALLQAAHRAGIHTVLETCGYTNYVNLARLLPWTDLFLYDIKETNPQRHKRFTGVNNKLILSNLKQLLKDDANVLIRSPQIPGYNDRSDHWNDLAELARALPQRVELEILPYNDFWQAKHKKFGLQEHTAFHY